MTAFPGSQAYGEFTYKSSRFICYRSFDSSIPQSALFVNDKISKFKRNILYTPYHKQMYDLNTDTSKFRRINSYVLRNLYKSGTLIFLNNYIRTLTCFAHSVQNNSCKKAGANVMKVLNNGSCNLDYVYAPDHIDTEARSMRMQKIHLSAIVQNRGD